MYSCVSKLSCWAFSAPRNSDGSTEYARASGAAASVSPTSHELLVPSITDTPWLPPLSQFMTASTSFIKRALSREGRRARGRRSPLRR